MSYCPEHGTKMRYSDDHDHTSRLYYLCQQVADDGGTQAAVAEVWVYDGELGQYSTVFPEVDMAIVLKHLACGNCQDGCEQAIWCDGCDESLCPLCWCEHNDDILW